MTAVALSLSPQLPLSALLLAMPLLSMAACRLAPSDRVARLLAVTGSGLNLVLAIVVLLVLDHGSSAMQFSAGLPLLPFLHLRFGVDGLSILFILATALLGFLVVLYGRLVAREQTGRYLGLVFGFQSVLTAMFLAMDLLLFWLLACVELLPAALLTLSWGVGAERRRATVVYLQFMASGLVLLLAGILVVAWQHAQVTGDWSFDLADVLNTNGMPANLQALAFVLMLYGLCVRMAQFPFHAWLPLLCQHGKLATAGVFLVGSKLGIYALLRFVLPLLPEAAHSYKLLAAALGLAGIFYGAVLALMQLNVRRLLAFAAISHTGMLMVGVFCLNREGLAGTLLLSITFGLAASGLLFAAGLVLRRAGSILLPRLGGLFDMMPLVGITFLISALSTMAMPGTPGFDAAHLLLEGAIESHDWTVAIALATGNVLSAAFLLWAFQRIFLAHRRETALRPLRVMPAVSEAVLTVTLVLTLLGVGFYTEPWLEVIDQSVRGLAARLDAGAKSR